MAEEMGRIFWRYKIKASNEAFILDAAVTEKSMEGG
jgi:hypothetical protein